MQASEAPLTKKDFSSDQEVRWCPGCGDYAILSAVQKVCPQLGVPKHNMVFVSGIGCSSRLPYYMATYGFHGIHGRAPAIATGIKIANPDLMVWVVTGDGDGLSIGTNHLVHVLRRNVDLNVLFINNRIYGLTKGQVSPTSEQGKKTKSTPLGSLERPLNPLALALASGATFVARVLDREVRMMESVFLEASKHKGTSFVEVYQNCNIFNDGAFERYRSKGAAEQVLHLRHGEPLLFGEGGEKGFQWVDGHLKVVGATSVEESSLLRHDEGAEASFQQALYGLLYSRLDLPTPFGVVRRVREPTYEEGFAVQGRTSRPLPSEERLRALFDSGNTWIVR